MYDIGKKNTTLILRHTLIKTKTLTFLVKKYSKYLNILSPSSLCCIVFSIVFFRFLCLIDSNGSFNGPKHLVRIKDETRLVPQVII